MPILFQKDVTFMPRPRVFFQGDYELLSSQFAGLVVAAKSGLFQSRGIDLVLRGKVRPGSEADVVAGIQEAVGDRGNLALGCAEQNIVVPAQAHGAPVQVVSAMYHKSPLGLGLLPTSRITSLKELAQRQMRVGMLADSLSLAQRLLHQAVGSS
ncbi:NMT1/THI5-like protein, partial [Nannochloropsis gaditana]